MLRSCSLQFVTLYYSSPDDASVYAWSSSFLCLFFVFFSLVSLSLSLSRWYWYYKSIVIAFNHVYLLDSVFFAKKKKKKNVALVLALFGINSVVNSSTILIFSTFLKIYLIDIVEVIYA